MRLVIFAALAALAASTSQAQQFFQSSDGTVDFSKAAFADSTDPANWDVITDSVAITRADVLGIYNPFAEAVSSGGIGNSPAGTLWAFGRTVQDVIDGVIGLGDFNPWVTAIANNPPATIGELGVIYLVDDDAFVDITFTEWGEGRSGGGSFSYRRAVVNVVPEPTGLGLMALAATGLAARRRRV